MFRGKKTGLRSGTKKKRKKKTTKKKKKKAKGDKDRIWGRKMPVKMRRGPTNKSDERGGKATDSILKSRDGKNRLKESP